MAGLYDYDLARNIHHCLADNKKKILIGVFP
jgi:hypothetical protein